MPMRKILLGLPEEQWQEAKECARKNRISISALIRLALTRFLNLERISLEGKK